jgi:hypothetical protein
LQGKSVVADAVFRVAFFKVLSDHYGHRHDCLQQAIEVSASDEAKALENAQRRFAELAGVARWELRADYARAERLPPPKRTARLRP